jgi:hypothetical protein
LGPDEKGSAIWDGSKQCNIFDGNKDKTLMWLALLFSNDKGPTGGGKADSTDDEYHCQKELTTCEEM